MQFDIEQATSILSRTPSVFSALLRDLPDSWVVHDLGHIAQATRVMARQYANQVGPWAEYLPVLRR